MSKDQKIKMPASHGGIMQYYEEYKGKVEMSPHIVVVLTIIVIILVVILHMVGPNLFGF